MQKKLLILPGNGIGPVVTRCGEMVLKHLNQNYDAHFLLDVMNLDENEYIDIEGMRAENIISHCKQYDYLLFGAAGLEKKEQNNSSGGLIIKLRKELDLYINLRPSKFYSDAYTPLKDCKLFNIAVVRENTECAYVNMGSRMKSGSLNEIAIQNMVYTREKTTKTIYFAFELAMKRNKKLTLCDKSNVLTYGHGLWKDIFYEAAKEYEYVDVNHFYIDALTAKLIRDPSYFDVIVTTNMFGDIISDLLAELQGGIGTAGSINMGDDRTVLIEPIHGAAFDLIDKEYANPIGMINSIIELIKHIGEIGIANRMEKALELLIKQKEVTPDMEGNLTAETVTKKFIEHFDSL